VYPFRGSDCRIGLTRSLTGSWWRSLRSCGWKQLIGKPYFIPRSRPSWLLHRRMFPSPFLRGNWAGVHCSSKSAQLTLRMADHVCDVNMPSKQQWSTACGKCRGTCASVWKILCPWFRTWTCRDVGTSGHFPMSLFDLCVYVGYLARREGGGGYRSQQSDSLTVGRSGDWIPVGDKIVRTSRNRSPYTRNRVIPGDKASGALRWPLTTI